MIPFLFPREDSRSGQFLPGGHDGLAIPPNFLIASSFRRYASTLSVNCCRVQVVDWRAISAKSGSPGFIPLIIAESMI
jgi:hypothetical protein